MPPVDQTKVRLCSNLLREPQVFDQLGNLEGAIARDLIIYATWNNADETMLHLPHFCKMMGYKRQHLLMPLTEQKKAWLYEEGAKKEDIEYLKTMLGYVLMRMGRQTLEFAKISKRTEERNQQYRKPSMRFDYLQLVTRVTIDYLSTGTVARYTINPRIMEMNRGKHMQTMYLPDYLSLCTPKGRADDQARRMYMRLVWKRRLWDKLTVKKGYHPSQDSYGELKAVAGLNYAQEKKNASLLRTLLKRVGKLESVKMIPSVKLDPRLGVYLVSWKRDGDLKLIDSED